MIEIPVYGQQGFMFDKLETTVGYAICKAVGTWAIYVRGHAFNLTKVLALFPMIYSVQRFNGVTLLSLGVLYYYRLLIFSLSELNCKFHKPLQETG